MLPDRSQKYDNLLAPMFTIAFGENGIVNHYHADLGHDAIHLFRSKPGDVILWGPRDCGSHMFTIDPSERMNGVGIANLSVEPENWYVLRLDERRFASGIIAGSMEPLGAATREGVAQKINALYDEVAAKLSAG